LYCTAESAMGAILDFSENRSLRPGTPIGLVYWCYWESNIKVWCCNPLCHGYVLKLLDYSLSSPFTQKINMQLFRNDVIFPSRVSVSDNCKQSITVWLFTINILLTLFQSLVGPTNVKVVLQWQTVHADAVAGLWFTQNGCASVVNSTAHFLNSAQLSPLFRV